MARAARHGVRDRQRHRGRRPLLRLPHGRGRERSTRRWRRASRISTASTPSAWAPATASPCCATRSACKPAVLAETDDWVAMASEFRSIAHLPGVENASIWEPAPGHALHLEPGGPGMSARRSRGDRQRAGAQPALCTTSTDDTNDRTWTIDNPMGAHAIAVGLDAAGRGHHQRPCRLLLRRHEQDAPTSRSTAIPAGASPRT